MLTFVTLLYCNAINYLWVTVAFNFINKQSKPKQRDIVRLQLSPSLTTGYTISGGALSLILAFHALNISLKRLLFQRETTFPWSSDGHGPILSVLPWDPKNLLSRSLVQNKGKPWDPERRFHSRHLLYFIFQFLVLMLLQTTVPIVQSHFLQIGYYKSNK